jgi:hypothetical protein
VSERPPEDGAKPPSRRWVPITIGIAVAVAVIVTLVVSATLSSQSTGQGTASTVEPTASGATPTATTPGDATPTPTAPSPEPPPPELPEMAPVAPEEVATTDDGLSIRIAQAEAIEGESIFPGEVGGPALRYTVEISNAGPTALDLTYVAVNAFTGEQRDPASELTKPGGAPFQGQLAPGATATGVYLFSIDEADRDRVTLIVDYQAGQASAVFVGPAPS